MVTIYKAAGVSVNLRFRCIGYLQHVSGAKRPIRTVTYSAHCLGTGEIYVTMWRDLKTQTWFSDNGCVLVVTSMSWSTPSGVLQGLYD